MTVSKCLPPQIISCATQKKSVAAKLSCTWLNKRNFFFSFCQWTAFNLQEEEWVFCFCIKLQHPTCQHVWRLSGAEVSCVYNEHLNTQRKEKQTEEKVAQAGRVRRLLVPKTTPNTLILCSSKFLNSAAGGLFCCSVCKDWNALLSQM